MTAWTRAPFHILCGLCARVIRRGDPVLLLTLPGLTRVKRRCSNCAGEAPPDLPAIVEVVIPSPTPMVPVRRLAGLPFDWKIRQAGEREPGCDDE